MTWLLTALGAWLEQQRYEHGALLEDSRDAAMAGRTSSLSRAASSERIIYTLLPVVSQPEAQEQKAKK